MSWLARIQIDYATAARHRLRDNYAWHQAIWKAFPGRNDEERSFLFRVNARDDGPEVLMLTRVEPIQPDWCPDEGWSVRQIKPEFLGHRHYRFDLRANATRKVTKLTVNGGPNKNGRRAVISGEQELRAWLDRKATQGGFRMVTDPPLVIDPRTDYHFRKGNTSGLHVGVRFRGALEVTDSERFKEAFQVGIGSAKAFGFGLLLLQPVRLISE